MATLRPGQRIRSQIRDQWRLVECRRARAISVLASLTLFPPLLYSEEKAENPTNPPPAKPAVEDLGNGKYQLSGIQFDSTSREVSFPGIVNLDSELLEYAIVNEKGATHEALLRTNVRPFDIQVALLLLRYKPYKDGLFANFDRDAETPEEGEATADQVPQTAQIGIFIRWEQGGDQKEVAIEEWVKDTQSGNLMPKGFWQFNGFPAPTNRHWKPEHESNVVGIYLSEYAPLNFPQAGNRRDDVWIPNKEAMPPVETAVTIIFRPVVSADEE